MITKFKTMLTAALVLALGTSAALAQNANTAFEQKAQALNKAAKQGGKMTTALNAISTETGVPQDQVQAMHNSHPGVGAAAILIASVMADQTKKPAENFLQERAGGTSWEAIASANKVPLQTIEQRLDNVQRALTNPQQTAATSTTTPQATTTPQPATTGTSTTSAAAGSLDQRVASLNQAVQSTGNSNAVINAISVETGVPKNQVQTLAQNHPQAGLGGVLSAAVLADEKGQPVESFLQSNASGKTWDTLASDNHVALTKFFTRFDRVQGAAGATPGAVTPTGR